MYWALTGIQNTRPSMRMLCERRACLNDRTGLRASTGSTKEPATRSLQRKCCAAMMVRNLGLEWVTDGCRTHQNLRLILGLLDLPRHASVRLGDPSIPYRSPGALVLIKPRLIRALPDPQREPISQV